jgi:hypothetical protein
VLPVCLPGLYHPWENSDALTASRVRGPLGQPIQQAVFGNAEPDPGNAPTEYKRDSFGVLNGRIVALDDGELQGDLPNEANNGAP